MANKIFKKAFAADFTGIDGVQSAIENEGDAVNRAVNYEMSVGNSLRGRVGIQSQGKEMFFATFPWNYTRTQDQYNLTYLTNTGAYPNQTGTLGSSKITADGATISKWIGLNGQCWVRDNLTITPDTQAAGTYAWYTYVNGSNINFKITKNGASILDTSLGNGISSYVTIKALLDTIHALGDFNITYGTRGLTGAPPFAIANGPQTAVAGTDRGYGTSQTITVFNTPHTFQPGDLICFQTTATTGAVAPPLKAGFVVAKTNTTITYVGPSITLANNDIIGYMAQPATAFNISTSQTATNPNVVFSFPYWKWIPDVYVGRTSDSQLWGSFFTWLNREADTFYKPAVSTNMQGCLYFASSGISKNSTDNLLRKIDGQNLINVGLPQPAISTATAAGALTGVYKYKVLLRFIDAQGNLVEGQPSDISSLTLAVNSVNITINSNLTYNQLAGGAYGGHGAYKYTLETPNVDQYFYVDDNTAAPGNNAFIKPGDLVFYLDNVAPLVGLGIGSLHKDVCTGYDGSTTPSSIRLGSTTGAYTIPDNSPISCGLTAVILRTTAGGNQYYVLAETPITKYGTLTISDNVADALLSAQEQYIEVAIGKEHNPPPYCSLVCEHQGGLVVARGGTVPRTSSGGTIPYPAADLGPNSVAFSSADGIEYFPTASNSFDVPSGISSAITAIASDTVDRLAIFKEKAYYEANGDLDGGVFTINVKNEGDFGISSQASLAKVNGVLIGVSKLGFVVINEGLLDPYKFKDVSARIINQPYFTQYAVAVNDHFNRQYICTIPTEIYPGVSVAKPSVSWVIDYSRGDIKVLERSYATGMDQAGGMAMIGDTLCHLSVGGSSYRRLPRFDSTNPSPTGNNGDSFIDNTLAISYILESQPINFGEPGILKVPIRVRLWSIPNDYVQEGWVPFSFLVESGASPIASYVGSGGTNNTSSTVSFATVNDVYKDVKLQNQKTFFYIFRLTTNTIRTAPFLTGYEIMFAESYVKEDFAK